MGDRAMTACLIEQLTALRNGFLGSLQAWYDDGADLAEFQASGYPIALSFAWGYIAGAADMADLTPMSLLEEHGLSLDPKPTKRSTRAATDERL